jgi:hypothetical protein
MQNTSKKFPLIAKILVGLVVLVGIGAIISQNRHHSSYSPSYSSSSTGTANGGEIRTAATHRSSGDKKGRLLAQYQAQYNQLNSQMTQCYQQMQALIATGGAPPCEQYMGMWTAELAVAQTNVYRIQTGNYQATILEVTGVQVTPSSSGGLVKSSDVSGSDNGVGDWDRAELHGTSLYTDENGEQHELATANYYYRNKTTGDMVPTNTETPPDYQHDWEEMQPVTRHQ